MSVKKYPIDESTGLTAVPEGFFWKVKRGGIGGSVLVVQLRRKFLFFSYVIDDTAVFPNIMPTAEESVLWATNDIIDKAESRVYNDNGIDRVVGKYPPKSIGGK